MKKLIFTVTGLLLLPVSAGAEPPPPPPPPPHAAFIAVSGEAETEIMPDQAILSLSVVTRSKELPKAKEENDKLTEKLVGVARSLDIPKDKIATSRIYISPQYRYERGSSKRILEDYMVSRSMRITMDKVELSEKMLSAAVDADIDQINGVEYRLSKQEEARDKLRAQAVENARARAETLAKAAGVKVGPAIMISTSGAVLPPMPRPMAAMADMAMVAKSAEMSVAPSLPGLITLHESVNVTFALE